MVGKLEAKVPAVWQLSVLVVLTSPVGIPLELFRQQGHHVHCIKITRYCCAVRWSRSLKLLCPRPGGWVVSP